MSAAAFLQHVGGVAEGAVEGAQDGTATAHDANDGQTLLSSAAEHEKSAEAFLGALGAAEQSNATAGAPQSGGDQQAVPVADSAERVDAAAFLHSLASEQEQPLPRARTTDASHPTVEAAEPSLNSHRASVAPEGTLAPGDAVSAAAFLASLSAGDASSGTGAVASDDGTAAQAGGEAQAPEDRPLDVAERTEPMNASASAESDAVSKSIPTGAEPVVKRVSTTVLAAPVDEIVAPTESIEFAVHSLKLDDAQRRDLLDAHYSMLWIAMHLIITKEPWRSSSVMVPKNGSSDDVHDLVFHRSFSGQLEVPIDSPAAQHLKLAMQAEDIDASSVFVSLHGAAASGQDGERIAEATISLRQMLRMGRDLIKAPLHLYDADSHACAAVVITFRALHVLKSVVGSASAGVVRSPTHTTNSSPPDEPTTGSNAPDRKTAPVLMSMARPSRSAPATAKQEVERAPTASEVADFEAKKTATKVAALARAPLKLPLRLQVEFGSIQLASRLSEDAGIARIELELDLVGLSEKICSSGRLPKPVSARPLRLRQQHVVPIYENSFARRCLVDASQTGPEGSQQNRVRLRLMGIGRTGLRLMAQAEVALSKEAPPRKPPNPTAHTNVCTCGSQMQLTRALRTIFQILLSRDWMEVLMYSPDVEDALQLDRTTSHIDGLMKMPQSASARSKLPDVSARVLMACRVMLTDDQDVGQLRSTPIVRPLHADDPSLCVYVTQLRVALDPQSTRGGQTGNIALLADVRSAHSVRLNVSIPGLRQPAASEILRIAELVAEIPTANSAEAEDANTLSFQTSRQRSDGVWGKACEVDVVASSQLYGEGSSLFDSLHQALTGGTVTTNDASIFSSDSVVFELLTVGRGGERRVGRYELSIAELMRRADYGDLVDSPIVLLSDNDQPVAEVRASVTVLGALRALHPAAATTPIGKAMSLPGAAIAVGVGECFLMTQRGILRDFFPQRIWMEADLRRSCAQLLRSTPRAPALVPRDKIDFGMRELIYVADGSAQQRRLAAILEPDAPPSHRKVFFSLYCTAARKRRDKGSEEKNEDGPELLLVGRAHIDLLELHECGGEMLYQPLEIRDTVDENIAALKVIGIVSVSFLAREAMQRARYSSVRAAHGLTIWIGCQHLALSAASIADWSVASVWLEVFLQVDGVTSPPVSSQRYSIKRRRSHDSFAKRGKESDDILIEVGFRMPLRAELGSALYKELKNALRPGRRDAKILVQYRLMGDGRAMQPVPGSDGQSISTLSTSRELGTTVLPLGSQLEQANASGARAQLVLRDLHGIRVGKVDARVEGLDALRKLARAGAKATIGPSAHERLAAAARKGDVIGMRLSVEAGGQIGQKDLWGQEALHWAAAAPAGEEAVQFCLGAGATVKSTNIAGMTPLHWAAAWGRLPSTQVLIRAGADPHAVDVRLANPATIACSLRTPHIGTAYRAHDSSRTSCSKRAMLRELLGERDAAASYIQINHRMKHPPKKTILSA